MCESDTFLVQKYLYVYKAQSYRCVVFVHRNSAAETVEQELLFVGAENGKLLAMRDLIKKVGENLDVKLTDGQVTIADLKAETDECEHEEDLSLSAF